MKKNEKQRRFRERKTDKKKEIVVVRLSSAIKEGRNCLRFNELEEHKLMLERSINLGGGD